MQIPLEISFRNMDPSDAVEARVRELAEKLERYYDRIMACRVVIEASHKHKHKGGVYHVRIDLTVQGNEIVINRETPLNRLHEDVYVVVRDAFNAAYRKLESYAARLRGDVKAHEEPPQGRIVYLDTYEGFGRIETPDGRGIYFHKNSVLNADFDKLQVGDTVRFAEEEGDEGPQASTVKVVGKQHVAIS